MRAIRAVAKGERAELVEVAEPTGELVLAVEYSSINYKDALAAAGRPGVLRGLPMTPGIDAVGVAPDGRTLVVTGAGLGERRDGGLAERVSVDPAVAVTLPAAFTARQAAAIGTAGVTAALAVLALERHGLPDGPVLVTGSGGGVGGFAIALLAAAGREVHASTGRAAQLGDHLRALGATEVVDRLPAEPGRPLQSASWAGVVDSVGGGVLANALAALLPGGVAAACGLAGSPELPTTVLPFILRGAALTGIDSVDLDADLRAAAWARLAGTVAPAIADALIEREIPLGDVPSAADQVLAGAVRGRLVVDPRR